MTVQEVTNFLSSSKQNCRLGTVDKRGNPNVHPVWFYYDSDTNTIYVNTNADSIKIENVKRKNTVYFCIDKEEMPVKGVKGRGDVDISTSPADNLPIAKKIMTKYFGNVDHPRAIQILRTVESGKSVLLKISPLYFSTWDFGKEAT